jgi:hypothetical protein
MPRVGLNPYALGMRLFHHIEDLAGKGKYSIDFRRLTDRRERERYDRQTGSGKEFLFKVRENLNDFLFINTFVEQDFVDRFRLFVAGRRLNQARGVWEIYIKSRSAYDYRAMLLGMLYHPPWIEIDRSKAENGNLYLGTADKPLARIHRQHAAGLRIPLGPARPAGDQRSRARRARLNPGGLSRHADVPQRRAPGAGAQVAAGGLHDGKPQTHTRPDLMPMDNRTNHIPDALEHADSVAAALESLNRAVGNLEHSCHSFGDF